MSWPELPGGGEGGDRSPLATAVHRHVDAEIDGVRPVSADEARGRAAVRARPDRFRPLMVAAAVLVTLGILAVVVRATDDREDTTVVDTDLPWPLTLDGQRDWLLAVLDGEHEPSDGELRSRLDATFLRAAPPDAFRDVVGQLAAQRPYSVAAEVERRDQALALQLLGSDGEEQLRLSLVVDDEGLLTGTLVLRATRCAEPLLDPGSVQLAPALRERLDWLVEVTGSRRTVGDDELAEVFDPGFLQAVPVEETRAALRQIAELGPLSLRWFEGEPSGTDVLARVGVFSGEEARVQLSIEPDPPHRITAAWVRTWEPCTLDL